MKYLNRFNTRIHHEQIRALYQQSPFLFLGILGVLAIVVVFFWNRVDHQILIPWLSANLLLTFTRIILVKRFYFVQPQDEALVKWGLVFVLSTTLSGIIWGMIAFLFMNPDDVMSVLLVALALTGMSSGSQATLSTFLPAFFGFGLPALLPLAVVLLNQPEDVYTLIGYLTILFITVNLGFSFLINRNVSESIRLRFENLDLLQSLRLQKTIAEKANTDKSRFLAATSHDLRQPLHAMDLYLGALKNLLTSNDQKELINKSRQSSAALSELLGALMDISRLDSGEVIVNRSIVDASKILRDIYNEFKDQAHQIGIELRLRAQEAFIDTDPVLFSRILRNLLSNALRHSQANKILLSSRIKTDKVCIEVRDNGCGIPSSETEKVFSEFYQLNNPERDRNKGLGLGLAIIKQLLILLGHEIILKSSEDKGCCFRLELLRINTCSEANAEANIIQDADVSGLFVMFIEDELGVRDAVRTLLKQWGCELLVADSLISLEDELRSLAYPPPDLIIVDYRLRENKTGLQAVISLRERFKLNIPAIVISGDTDKQVAQRVKREGCVMLNKPVSPELLRETIHQLDTTKASDTTDTQ